MTTLFRANGARALSALFLALAFLFSTATSGLAESGGVPPLSDEATAQIGDMMNASAGKWIEVSLGRQRMTAWENGRAVLSSLVSTGIPSHPTIPGVFRTYAKFRFARMTGQGYDLPNVPYVMYYSGSYGLHGTYWHHNFGHPMSHGCVNLPTPIAAQLFAWAPLGTKVVIHN